jgi:hypothetical protein
MSKMPSPTKPAPNKLYTLKDVVNFPEKIASTLGVILDFTGTYRTDDSFDYVTKLRVIDNTYNPKAKLDLNTEPTVFIFIYTKTEAEAPKLRNVGDIILLRNFYFDNYQTKDNNVVRGNYNKSCSEWQIFSGRANTATQAIEKSRTIPSKVFGEELEQIRKLREWLNPFFVNQGLTELSWYQHEFPQPVVSENVYQLKDVDLIVRIVAEVKAIVNGLSYHKIVFTDEKKQLYFAELQRTGTEFDVNSVVKLRSVCIFLHNNSRKIDFYNYSSIIQIPSHFKDAKEVSKKTADVRYASSDLENQFFEELHLDKYTKQQISSNLFSYVSNSDRKGKSTKNPLMDSFPDLERYDLSYVDQPNKKKSTKTGAKIGSIVLVDHADLKFTSLRELEKILRICKNSPSEYKNYSNQNFKVRVQISSLETTKPELFSKLYSASANKLWNLGDKEYAVIASKDVKIIFYLTMMTQEKDNTSLPPVPLYVVTYDGNPDNLFDLWKAFPELSDLESWLNLGKKSKKVSEMMEKLSSPDVEYDFVVQLIHNAEGNIYFRIVDSMFWFINP